MTSDFSMFYEKMSDFVWFPLFVLTLVIKTLIFDQKKKKGYKIWICFLKKL